MRVRSVATKLFVAMVASLTGANHTAHAALPDPPPQIPILPADWIITYYIHETPTDPESDVTFTIAMYLAAGDRDGESVGWDIVYIDFVQPGTGNPDTTWTEASPYVDSADGLWWIDHADGTFPDVAEFDMPPLLVGTAAADDPNDDDLEYDFEGVTYTTPPGGDPYAHNVALTYFLALAPEPMVPLEEGDDEPVDIDGEVP